jgi:hypothetical protein
MKKKILLFVALGLFTLALLAVVAVGFFLNSAIKKGVETFGPKVTQVDVKLDSVKLSLLSGSGRIEGFVLGNPAGYSTSNAISVGSASLQVRPGSLFSDKIVIKSINVAAPVITFEGSLAGNNLNQILANIKSGTGETGGTNAAAKEPSKESKAGRKVEVDEFIITGAKVNVNFKGLMGNKVMTLVLPDIHLTDLGTNADGITGGELTRRVLTVVEQEVLNAASKGLLDLGKTSGDLGKELSKSGSNAANNLLNNLLKKK